MAKTFVVCSILAPEVEKAMEELGLVNKINYIDGALHVNLNKLETAITESLEKRKLEGEQAALVVGTNCHPNMQNIIGGFGAEIICGTNCVGILLGEEKMRELDSECNTFYLTTGWLQKWREIFCEGHGWDKIDARMNFGMYERILLLDTGLTEFSEEDIFEFFEFTEVPIETYPVTLDNLKDKLLELAG